MSNGAASGRPIIISDRGPALHFAGRKEELGLLGGFLDHVIRHGAQNGLRLITGVPGSGKTALGSRFASLLPKGVRHCPLEAQALRFTIDAFNDMAAALGVAEAAGELTGHDTRSTGMKGGAFGVQNGTSQDDARHTPSSLGRLLRTSKTAGLWEDVDALVITIDELQNVGQEDADNLQTLHEGVHGCPIMVVGMGLQHTREVLGQRGISRVGPPIVLGPLSVAEAREVFVGTLTAHGIKVADACLEMMVAESQQFPEHIQAYMSAAVKVAAGRGVVRADEVQDVKAEGDALRQAYYQSRLNAMGVLSPHRALSPLLDAIRANGGEAVDEMEADKLCRQGDYANDDVGRQAIAHGVLTRLGDDKVGFGIPSFRDYMFNQQPA